MFRLAVGLPWPHQSDKQGKEGTIYRAPTNGKRRGGLEPAPTVLIHPPADPRRIGSDGRGEFAGDEGVEDAEAGGKLDGGQTMLIVEPTEKICRGKIAFLQVAFAAAGDEVAIGIVLQLGKRDDMVDAARTNGKPAATVKTKAAFPQMDGAAQSRMFQKVQILEMIGAIGAQGARVIWTGADGGYFPGQVDLDQVSRFAALDQSQEASRYQAAHGPTHGVATETDTASEPRNGKPELKFSFEAAVTKKMSIDDAVGHRQAQARSKVLELFPHPFGIGSFDFHGFDPRGESQSVKKHGVSRGERKLAQK